MNKDTERHVYRAPQRVQRTTASNPRHIRRAPAGASQAGQTGQTASPRQTSPARQAAPARQTATARQTAPARQASRPRRKANPVLRALAGLGVTLGMLLVFCLGASAVICLGPSPSARDLFVNTCMETSALKFIPRIFFEESRIEAIRAKNGVLDSGAVTDTSVDFTQSEDALPLDTIEIEDVSGPSFKGKMMIVHDPSRVKVASLDSFSPDVSGKRLLEYVEEAGAVAGINGGGFQDLNGVGNGGMPLGLVIRDGKLLAGGLNSATSVIGFDNENHLVVGTMTGQEALDRGIRDALSFGPVFIVNGEPAEVTGSGGGLNPRTVIGQRADGAVLLLTIDGRQPQSLGASYEDCIQVMLDYGAINAANLDGGSSTQMVYQGETINVCASLYGPRRLPTAFIVM